jgi:3-oxoacyl-[acyl-carrier protein] reductase
MQTMLISGTSKGIGKYLAEYYCKDYHVIGCSRTPSNIKHKNFTEYLLDVSDEDKVKKMFKDIKSLDVLINNAGVASMNSALLISLTRVQEVINVNFIGTFLMCREAVKIMMKRKYGRIVNFSSIAVPLNLPGEAIYGSIKSAIETFSRILSKEIAPFNITVNIIGPSAVNTNLIKSLPKEKVDKVLQLQSIPKLADFSDISNTINYFINEESKFVTGQTIYLGGLM